MSEDSNDESNANDPLTQQSDKNEEGEDNLDISVPNHQITDLPVPEVSLKEKPVKQWMKKESRKRQIEKTDADLNKAMTNLNESIALQQKSAKEKKMDEDGYYVLSLDNRLRNLD